MAERVPEPVKQMARAQSVLGRTGSADDIAQMVVAYWPNGQRNGGIAAPDVCDGTSAVGESTKSQAHPLVNRLNLGLSERRSRAN